MNAGVIYFVIKPKCVHRFKHALIHYKYAVESAKSFKKYMPWLPLTVYTNIKQFTDDCFDNVIYKEEEIEDRWEFKYRCLLDSPYEYTLHMDADTYVVEDFSDVFELMKNFDLAITLSVWHLRKPLPEMPKCFPELAGGFILWKKNEKTDAFLNKMYGICSTKGRRNDEPYLRKCLYEGDVRFVVLPWEYNCVMLQPGYLFSSIKVMHGRGFNVARDTALFNSRPERRIFTGQELIFLKKSRHKHVQLDEIVSYNQL